MTFSFLLHPNRVETFAVARNVEDLAAAKITPMIPDDFTPDYSRRSSSWSARMPSSMADSKVSLNPGSLRLTTFLQSNIVLSFMPLQSSELITDRPSKMSKLIKDFEKKLCGELETFGIKACAVFKSRNASFIRDVPLYAVVGKHSVLIEVTPGKLNE